MPPRHLPFRVCKQGEPKIHQRLMQNYVVMVVFATPCGEKVSSTLFSWAAGENKSNELKFDKCAVCGFSL